MMNTVDQIEKLHQLKQEGILSEQEFTDAKAKLMEQAGSEKPAVSFKQAYLSYWKNSFVWRGRSTRAEYWWPVLAYFLINLCIQFMSLFAALMWVHAAFCLSIALLLFAVANIFPGLAVWVRRFHDRGKRAWFAFAPYFVVLGSWAFMWLATQTGLMTFLILAVVGMLVYFIMLIVWLVFLALPGTPGPNRYGDPK